MSATEPAMTPTDQGQQAPTLLTLAINPNEALRAVRGFHADCIQPSDVMTLPKVSKLPNVKALPDLLLMVENYGKAMGKAYVPRGGRLEYFDDRDAADLGLIIEEVERLQVAETDRDQMLEASTGVLLALSRLWLAGALSAEEVQAVVSFRDAVKEARQS